MELESDDEDGQIAPAASSKPKASATYRKSKQSHATSDNPYPLEGKYKDEQDRE